MNSKLHQIISQASTDVSGKWISTKEVENLLEYTIRDCKNALRSSSGDNLSTDQAYTKIKAYFGLE